MSTKTAFVRARMDAELKKQAESILENLGLSPGNAISAFYKQIEIHKGIPFDLKLNSSKVESRLEKEDLAKNYQKIKNKKHLKDLIELN